MTDPARPEDDRGLIWLLTEFLIVGAATAFARAGSWPVRRLVTGPRPGRGAAFLDGLPALAVGLGIVGVLVAGTRAHDSAVTAHRKLARTSLNTAAYETAQLCFARLADLGADDRATRLGIGRALAGRGETAAALALIGTLAPTDADGYAPAQAWMARHLLARSRSPRALREAELHLRRALQTRSDEPEDLRLLASVYRTLGEHERGEALFERAVKKRRAWSLELALFYREWASRLPADAPRRPELLVKSRNHAERAVTLLGKRLGAHPQRHKLRLERAAALQLLGRFEEAIALIETARQKYPRVRYDRTLAELYVNWSRRAGEDPERLVTLAGQALAAEPTGLAPLQRMIELGRLPGPAGEAARRAIAGYESTPRLGGQVHLVLGNFALDRGDAKAAAAHFEKALARSPGDGAAIANNLAYALCQGERPDLRRALALIRGVLRLHPHNRHYRDTRGRILARLGRWAEALPDLEYGAPAVADPVLRHTTLAEAYEQLGQPAVAARHRRLATPKRP